MNAKTCFALLLISMVVLLQRSAQALPDPTSKATTWYDGSFRYACAVDSGNNGVTCNTSQNWGNPWQLGTMPSGCNITSERGVYMQTRAADAAHPYAYVVAHCTAFGGNTISGDVIVGCKVDNTGGSVCSELLYIGSMYDYLGPQLAVVNQPGAKTTVFVVIQDNSAFLQGHLLMMEEDNMAGTTYTDLSDGGHLATTFDYTNGTLYSAPIAATSSVLTYLGRPEVVALGQTGGAAHDTLAVVYSNHAGTWHLLAATLNGGGHSIGQSIAMTSAHAEPLDMAMPHHQFGGDWITTVASDNGHVYENRLDDCDNCGGGTYTYDGWVDQGQGTASVAGLNVQDVSATVAYASGGNYYRTIFVKGIDSGTPYGDYLDVSNFNGTPQHATVFVTDSTTTNWNALDSFYGLGAALAIPGGGGTTDTFFYGPCHHSLADGIGEVHLATGAAPAWTVPR